MKTLPLLSLALLLVSMHISAQVKFAGPGALPSAVNTLYRYLKDTPTNERLPAEKLHEDSLYLRVLDQFFDTTAMVSRFQQRDIPPVLLFQVLYNIDCGIDQFPPDSIIAMHAGYYYARYGEGGGHDTIEIPHRYFITFLIAGKYYPVLDVCMNGNGRFNYLLPMIYFDREKGRELDAFFRRHTRK